MTEPQIPPDRWINNLLDAAKAIADRKYQESRWLDPDAFAWESPDEAINALDDSVLNGFIEQFSESFSASAERSDNVQIQYLYKTDVEEILSGLKANDPVNDWVLRHTKEDASFIRIAQMISCFGKAIERETTELRFEAVSMDCDFVKKISDLSEGMTT